MNSRWNWRAQREKSAFLALADGTVFHGHSVGAEIDTLGEVVFNTGMTGYQEILSDPSYSGQLVTMTCPEIGNTGINAADMESSRLFANGFILHEMNAPSNWRAEASLAECLRRNAIPAIAGIDTRALTSKLRDQGTLKGYLAVSGKITEQQAIQLATEWGGLDGQDYAAKVSCKQPYLWDETGKLSASWGIAENLPKADLKVVAYDFGIKWNILRSLRRNGMAVTVVPATTSADEVLALKPQGVLLSNGPADPAAVTYAIASARKLMGKVPLMGICLGHQLLGLANGGRTLRIKFGHHGCNHPVKDLKTGRVEITSQNHNFTVDPDSLDPAKMEITHINLNDQTVEGLEHKQEPMFSVQYHPEACPGPHDPYYLFGRFRELITKA
jgi:carbamoyl-phosphate synthase small subunit